MKGRDFGVATGWRHASVVQISKQISAVFSRDFDTLRAFSKDNETSGASPRELGNSWKDSDRFFKVARSSHQIVKAFSPFPQSGSLTVRNRHTQKKIRLIRC